MMTSTLIDLVRRINLGKDTTVRPEPYARPESRDRYTPTVITIHPLPTRRPLPPILNHKL